jgi:hypothetical protein
MQFDIRSFEGTHVRIVLALAVIGGLEVVAVLVVAALIVLAAAL